MQSHEEIFQQGEADMWFKRNKGFLEKNLDCDPVINLVKKYALNPKKVLEIGSSNGYRLGYLSSFLNAVFAAVEPSQLAIEDGKKKYPFINFTQGVASNLPLDEKFDLVIVNFVLHWVSRDVLLKTIAEIDRVLEDGGFLIIGDFEPDFPTRNHYHHLQDKNIYTYKMDYKKIFMDTALYTTVESITFDHSSMMPNSIVKSNERVSCALMRKSLSEFYSDTKKL